MDISTDSVVPDQRPLRRSMVPAVAPQMMGQPGETSW